MNVMYCTNNYLIKKKKNNIFFSCLRPKIKNINNESSRTAIGPLDV